jgi:hypothetical protein
VAQASNWIFVVEAGLEAVETVGEDLFERGAALGGEGLPGDDEGQELGFREGGAGEGLGWIGEEESVPGLVILDADVVVFPEEFDVASDGAGGDFEFPGEAGGVGESAFLEEFEELAEAGVEATGGAMTVG